LLILNLRDCDCDKRNLPLIFLQKKDNEGKLLRPRKEILFVIKNTEIETPIKMTSSKKRNADKLLFPSDLR
jgi:hypothetical protein